MMRLGDVTHKLQAKLTGSVTTDELTISVSYTDYNDSTGAMPMAVVASTSNGTTVVDIANGGPSSGAIRVVNYVSIYNADSADATVIVEFYDGSTAYPLVKQTLTPGASLQYTEQGGWGTNGPFEVTLSDVGTSITGASLPAGGSGLMGWLSAIWKALTDQLPSALTGLGNLKVSIEEDNTSGGGRATEATLASVESWASFSANRTRGVTADCTNVSGSATSVMLLDATAPGERVGASFWNDSAATLYLKFGTTASTTSCTKKMAPDEYWEIPYPTYVGRIDGIWSSAAGAVRITEVTVT